MALHIFYAYAFIKAWLRDEFRKVSYTKTNQMYSMHAHTCTAFL